MIFVLFSGAAYLPLDVAFPLPMLQSVLEDANPSAVVTVKELQQNLTGTSSKVH